MPIYTIIDDRAKKTPEKIAIVDGEIEFTYSKLVSCSNQIANGLARLFTMRNQPVGVLLGKDADAVYTFIGVMKSGSSFIGLEPSSPTAHLKNICNDLQLRVILTTKSYLPIAEKLLPQKGQIILLEDWLTTMPETPPDVQVSLDDTAAIFFTSGSTGKSKGVEISHLGLWHRTTNYIKKLKISPSDRAGSPLHLSYGWAPHAILSILAAGGTIYIYDYLHKTPFEIADWFEDNALTIAPLPSALLKQFVAVIPENYPTRFPNLRVLVTGGSPIDNQDIKLWQTRFSEHSVMTYSYASTEAGLVTHIFFTSESTLIPNESPKHGIPLETIDLLILDEDHKPLPFGEHGEIAIRSDSIMTGYWNRPDLNKKRFMEDPDFPGKKLLLTGDMGYLEEDHTLVFIGRKDLQVKIRGYLVNTAEVENALGSLPAVHEAVIQPYQRENGGLSLTAYLSFKDGYMPSITEIKNQLSARLPSYMIPQFFCILDEFPLGTSGKVDISQLPDPILARPDLPYDYVKPRDTIEEKLVAIWENVLGIHGIGVEDRFFDLGGDSLMATTLFIEIETEFNRKLPLSILMKTETIRAQGNILKDDEYLVNWSPVVPIRTEGDLEPIFFFAGKGGNPLRFRALAELLDPRHPIYFMQSRGLDGKTRPFNKVPEIAADFISEIQKHHPVGPYHLIGSSFGGLVAYEIASQLPQNDVGLVAMLDTYAPAILPLKKTGTSKFGKFSNLVQKHFRSLFLSGTKTRKEYIRYYKDFLPKAAANQFRRARAQIGRKLSINKLPPELKKVEEANLQAAIQYKPQPFEGDVILVRAKFQNESTKNEASLGWESVSIGNLNIFEVSSHHGDMLFYPAIKEVGEILSTYLGSE